MVKRIFLIHGLSGSKEETWGRFPELLESDPEIESKVWVWGYNSPPLWKVWSNAPTILSLANGLLTKINLNFDLIEDEIVFVGHSLGGIIIKQLLLNIHAAGTPHNIKKVCFFDVPHNGSGFATVGKLALHRNRHLKQLCQNSEPLENLNNQWAISGLDQVYDILSAVADNDDVVSASSSKSSFRNHQIETISNTTHTTIVKPENANSDSYLVLKKFLKSRKSVSRYQTNASQNFVDWQLQDNRKHTYGFIADEERQAALGALIEAINTPQRIVRLTGASGLGKTRLLIEAIRDSEAINNESVLVFDGAYYESEIVACVIQASKDGASGLIVVENCSVELHNRLEKNSRMGEGRLCIVTVAFDIAQVEAAVEISVSRISDEAIVRLLKPVLVDLDTKDIERISKFVEGFPLLAIIIAEQYKTQKKLFGQIDDDAFVAKLVDGDNAATQDEKEILYACSLFDVFGISDGDAGEEAKFIAEHVAGLDISTFEKSIFRFGQRQIVNRIGRYGRVSPKPLALALASKWWEVHSFSTQKKLIDKLPDSLIESFSAQAIYLDTLPAVQKFSGKLFGGSSPFFQAEELLTKKGSKFFRAFVEITPETTGSALHNALRNLPHDQLGEIGGATRRNFLWGLEKLCFHKEAFRNAAWCILFLATAETENYTNNATGMFAQLFNARLSGVNADYGARLSFLKEALSLNQAKVDMVVLQALKNSIATRGNSRTIGAEYQGGNVTLKEWVPDTWQEIFDYWDESLTLLTIMMDRGEPQKDEVLSIIGHSIRQFVAAGRTKKLDEVIKEIIEINGPYWPAALNDIKTMLSYDAEKMSATEVELINEWAELLNPKSLSLPEKLRIVVLDPPSEHRRDDNGSFRDLAEENSELLAVDVAKEIGSLYPLLNLLMEGDQKQSQAFGYKLALELKGPNDLLILTLKAFANAEQANINFVFGVYKGMFERSSEDWQRYLNLLLTNPSLVKHYPALLRSGKLQSHHLDTLIDLVRNESIRPNNLTVIGYGSASNNLQPLVAAEFCLKLSEFGDEGAWCALDIIFMYWFGEKESIHLIREPLKELVTKVSIPNDRIGNGQEMFHWQSLASALLQQRDGKLALALSQQIVRAAPQGFDYSDLSDYIKPLLVELMRDYGETIWPYFGKAVTSATGIEIHWLQNLLEREGTKGSQSVSVMSVLPTSQVIDWCKEHPNVGPSFVASCVGVFEDSSGLLRPSSLFVELLENFGNREDVLNALSGNMHSGLWSGSLVPILNAEKEALRPLLGHENETVVRWVKEYAVRVDRQIEWETARDAEDRMAGFR